MSQAGSCRTGSPSPLEIAGGWSVISDLHCLPSWLHAVCIYRAHRSRVPFLTLLCLCLLSGPDCAELWTILGNTFIWGWTPVRPHQFLIWFNQTIATAVAKMLQNQTERFPTVQPVVNGLSVRSWTLLCQILVEICTQTAPNMTITCVSWVIMFIETTSAQFHLLFPKCCLQSHGKRRKCAELT